VKAGGEKEERHFIRMVRPTCLVHLQLATGQLLVGSYGVQLALTAERWLPAAPLDSLLPTLGHWLRAPSALEVGGYKL